MYQQSLDLRDRFSEQLSFDFPYEPKNAAPYLVSIDPALSITGTTNAALSVTQLEVNGNGLYIRQENKSWLKTKVANWLGVKYL